MSEQPIARRCSNCAVSWPLTDEFVVCPYCARYTWATPKSEYATTFSLHEAQVIARHEKFERMYAEREKKIDQEAEARKLAEEMERKTLAELAKLEVREPKRPQWGPVMKASHGKWGPKGYQR